MRPANSHTTAIAGTDVNLDITGFVNPQFSSSAVETSAPQVIGSLPPLEEFAAPVYNQTPVFEYAAPAPVTGYIAPAPAVTSDAHSQQLPPVYTTTTVTTDDNLDITGLMYPQFSSTAVEPFSPHVVGSLPPWKSLLSPCTTKSIRLHRSLIHFSPLKSLLRPCTIESIRSRSLQER